MFCCKSKDSSSSFSLLGWIFLLVVGGFVVASLPEIKRYIKISTM